ncbi:hypothetical protein R1flu_026165 [Riccia fluitans]|uniref:Uncharacterized protein n=1 Tax=Riccia fluitans TaxID=41844 RepID=A0ABD1XF77_9MARC
MSAVGSRWGVAWSRHGCHEVRARVPWERGMGSRRLVVGVWDRGAVWSKREHHVVGAGHCEMEWRNAGQGRVLQAKVGSREVGAERHDFFM